MRLFKKKNISWIYNEHLIKEKASGAVLNPSEGLIVYVWIFVI